MKKSFGLLGLVLLFLTFPLAAQTIVVRADSWMPFDGDPQSSSPGFMVEVLKEIYKSENITIDFQIMPWARALQECKEGRIDAVIGAYLDDVKGFVVPSKPFCDTYDSFFVLKGNKWRYTGVNSLKEITLGYVLDYTYNPDIDAYLAAAQNNPKVQGVGGDDPVAVNLRKLTAKRLDAVIENEAVLKWKWAELKLPGEIESAGNAAVAKGLYIAFTPKKAESRKFAEMFDKGIAKLAASGRLAALKAKYKIK